MLVFLSLNGDPKRKEKEFLFLTRAEIAWDFVNHWFNLVFQYEPLSLVKYAGSSESQDLSAHSHVSLHDVTLTWNGFAVGYQPTSQPEL